MANRLHCHRLALVEVAGMAVLRVLGVVPEQVLAAPVPVAQAVKPVAVLDAPR